MPNLRAVPDVPPRCLRASAPRLRRLREIENGEMSAFLVKTVRNGNDFVTWMPHGDSWSVTWLLQVPELWEMAVDIAPLGEMHLMYLTDQGKKVLADMERALKARDGREKP